MIRISSLRIDLRRIDETIIIMEDDYSAAYIEDVEDIKAGMPYLKVIDNDGNAKIYPLDYWTITLCGGKSGVMK